MKLSQTQRVILTILLSVTTEHIQAPPLAPTAPAPKPLARTSAAHDPLASVTHETTAKTTARETATNEAVKHQATQPPKPGENAHTAQENSHQNTSTHNAQNATTTQAHTTKAPEPNSIKLSSPEPHAVKPEPTATPQAPRENLTTKRTSFQAFSNTINNAASKIGAKVGLTKGTIKRTTTNPETGVTTVETTAPGKPDVVLSSKITASNGRNSMTTNFKVDSKGDYVLGADGKPLIKSTTEVVSHIDNENNVWKSSTTTINDNNGQPQTITTKNSWGITLSRQKFDGKGGYTLTNSMGITKLEISHVKETNNRVETLSKYDSNNKLLETTVLEIDAKTGDTTSIKNTYDKNQAVRETTTIETDAKTGNKTSITKDADGKIIQTIRDIKNEKGQLVSNLEYSDGTKATITLENDFTLKVQDFKKDGVPLEPIVMDFTNYIKNKNDEFKSSFLFDEEKKYSVSFDISYYTRVSISSDKTSSAIRNTGVYKAFEKNVTNAININPPRRK